MKKVFFRKSDLSEKDRTKTFKKSSSKVKPGQTYLY